MTARTQVWLESLGDWSWPGSGAAAVEIMPPPWVPAFPSPVEPVPVVVPSRSGAARARNAVLWGMAGLLAALCVLLAFDGRTGAERLLGIARTAPAPAVVAADYAAPPSAPLPALKPISRDGAGSTIAATYFHSAALHSEGSFLVYLPPGYSPATEHYPVLYLLHGDEQPAEAFLRVGLGTELDSLITAHTIPAMIAVMIQGGRGPNNWDNWHAAHYEDYVVEVQELVDRMLPTIAERQARAIAGDSMGGFGAMHVALDHPQVFGTVESWIGFFNGLQGILNADRPVIQRLGLHAFVYGAASDTIANPAEDPTFAESLNAAGASAQGIIYPGTHSLATVGEHLAPMLTFIGQYIGAPAPVAKHLP